MNKSISDDIYQDDELRVLFMELIKLKKSDQKVIKETIRSLIAQAKIKEPAHQTDKLVL